MSNDTENNKMPCEHKLYLENTTVGLLAGKAKPEEVYVQLRCELCGHRFNGFVIDRGKDKPRG